MNTRYLCMVLLNSMIAYACANAKDSNDINVLNGGI